MVAVTRTIPAAEAKPRTAGFTLFLVDVKQALADGTLTYQPIPKMGSNILYSSQVFFDDVRVPGRERHRRGRPRLRGPVGRAQPRAHPGRCRRGRRGRGRARPSPCDYARERTVFNRPIGANQAIQFPLAQIKAKTELGRLMTYKAAWLFDRGEPCGSEANIAKLTGAQVAWEAANQAFQTLGGMAYSKEYPVERMFRDARIGKNIPVAEELVLAHIGTQVLGLPKSY